MGIICDIPVLLAQDSDDWNILWLIGLVLFFVISGLIRRGMEKKQEQEAAEARRRESQKQREEAKRRGAMPPQQAQPAQARRRPMAQRRPAAQPPRLPEPAIIELTPAPRDLGEGVEGGMRREEQRRRADELRRQQRLTARKPPEADSEAIERRLTHLRPGSAEAEALRAFRRSVQLRTPEQARRAIIFHEIFSAPKALRQGPEMWDT